MRANFRKASLTLCGTRKLQLFYTEILPEFKNRPMLETANSNCKKIIKVKKIIQNFWNIFQKLRILSKCCRTGYTVLQRVKPVKERQYLNKS